MSELGQKSLARHKEYKGKIGTMVKMPLATHEDLSIAYMPGVADVTMACSVDPENAYQYTLKQNSVAVVSDGSSVLGLGNIGAVGAIPVMEGKAMLFKHFAGIDAWPICLVTQEPEEIIKIVKNIAPVFGAILLEDIAAPRCFMVEEMLQDIGIPVMHDDQHGTAVVTRAALINAAKVAGKPFTDLNVVISGGGAAGQATAKMLIGDGAAPGTCESVADVVVVDSKGIIVEGRSDLDPYKQDLAGKTNKQKKTGDLKDAMQGADVFIGLSRGNLVTPEMVSVMVKDPIVFALSNPDPEIHPSKAKEAGAAIIATGRGDFPNQVNNSLGFPGLFLGALQAHAKQITFAMKLAASNQLAALVANPTAENIIPLAHQEGLVAAVAEKVKAAAQVG